MVATAKQRKNISILRGAVHAQAAEEAASTRALLAQYGLESLTDWAIKQMQLGVSDAELDLKLRERPEFVSRFPAIAERARKGLPPVSVDEYLSYERTAFELANQYGIPLTQAHINEALSADVSADELNQRFQVAALAVYQTTGETRDELERLYGVTSGDLALYWMRPQKQLPELQRQFAAAELAGTARRTGFETQLTAAQAERLGEAGLTAEEAEAGFGELVRQEELFERTSVTEEDIDTETQLEALLGNAEAQQEIERRGERRVAKFGEGGQFATGQEGVRGVGSASR